jgi:hypothetical protein
LDKSIKSSAGQGGVNQNADVLTTQKLLNQVQVQWGGPQPLLAEDGYIGPKTNSAIRRTSAEPVSHVRQPTNLTCWAAAGTTLCGACDRQRYEIQTIMKRGHAADPGHGFEALFNNSQGLPPQDTGRYPRAINIRTRRT